MIIGATIYAMVLPLRQFLSGLCLFLVAHIALYAHDFYILPHLFRVAPNSKIVINFNNGDSFPESEAAPALSRLKNAELQSAAGIVAVSDLHIDGKRAAGIVKVPEQSGSLLLSAHTAPHFIELAPDKFLDYIKEEGLTHVIDWRAQHGETNKPSRERYTKFAKSLLVSGAPNNFYIHPIGFPIEIIPEADPYTLHPGDKLPVRVVFQGKPAADLQLEAAWSNGSKSKTAIVGRTDAQGRIGVPLAAEGKWRLHSLLMERCVEPAAADWESFWASLTFEVR